MNGIINQSLNANNSPTINKTLLSVWTYSNSWSCHLSVHGRVQILLLDRSVAAAAAVESKDPAAMLTRLTCDSST